MKKIYISISLSILCSCSVNKMAVKSVSSIIDNAMTEVFDEKDLDYSKQSLPANLKLMEILIANDEDEKLLLNASMGFCGYAWAFLDDSAPQQAETFYKKGIAYSEKLLEKKKILNNGKIDVKKLNKKNTPPLFWNTFCKSALINLNPSDSENSIMLLDTESQAMILKEKNPSYFHNAIYSILGSIYASKPAMMGGDLKKARIFFEKSLENDGNYFLLNKYMFARTYAVYAQDERLFQDLIEQIISSKNENSKEHFFDEIAKRKAIQLKEKKDDYF